MISTNYQLQLPTFRTFKLRNMAMMIALAMLIVISVSIPSFPTMYLWRMGENQCCNRIIVICMAVPLTKNPPGIIAKEDR